MALKIKVVIPPTKTGECGAAMSKVKWVLDAGDTGWVIQRMTRSHDVKKCDDTEDSSFNSPKDCTGTDVPVFWEAWRVVNGKVFIGGTAHEHTGDTFSSLLDHPNRKGKHKLIGKVMFVPGYTLTIGTGADDWQEGDIPRAGALPTRRTEPKGWTEAGSRDHTLAAGWECCTSTPPPPTITGDPSASDRGTEGERMKPIRPIYPSPAAQEVAFIIRSLPTWQKLSTDERAVAKLFERLSLLNQFHTNVIRGGIEFYIDQSMRRRSYTLEDQSRLYLVNRYSFKLPISMLCGQLPFFGGWIIPYENKNFNPSWPFHPQKGGELIFQGQFRGYMGDDFLALAEFDYFKNYYPRRYALG